MVEYVKYYMQDVNDNASKTKFSVISTFAGGGGSSIGYKLAGGNVLLANEFIQRAIETYSINFPETKILCDDICKLSAQDFLDAANIKKYDLDILDGSPPCSKFSVAGKRERGWNKTSKYSNTMQTNIEDLFFKFLNIADGIKPKVILCENVKGMTIGEPLKKLNQVVNMFESIGYVVDYRVLNSKYFGVPQSRERVFFLAIRDDICEKLCITNMNIGNIFPEPSCEIISIKEAFSDIINDENEEKMLLDYVNRTYHRGIIDKLPKNPPKSIAPKGSYWSMVRPAPNYPAPTITQRGQTISTCGVIHYEKDRKLTILELKRIMGLPEDYKVIGTFNEQAERIGRMVPPKLTSAIAHSIYNNVLMRL